MDTIYGLENIAPTILHLNGRAVAEDMDGRPIMEIFTNEFKKQNPVKFIPSYEVHDIHKEPRDQGDNELDDIKEKLKDLGYLS